MPKLLQSFLISTALTDDDDSLSGMYQCVSELPSANRETLAAIIIHLQKVSTSSETQMSVSNLAKVFGPTLIGHRSANPTHMEMLDDTKAQPVVCPHYHFKIDVIQNILSNQQTRSLVGSLTYQKKSKSHKNANTSISGYFSN